MYSILGATLESHTPSSWNTTTCSSFTSELKAIQSLPAPQLSVASHTLTCRHRIITDWNWANPPARADCVPALPSRGWKGKEVKHLLHDIVIWKPKSQNHLCPWSLPCMTFLPRGISWRQSSLGSDIPACFNSCSHTFNTIMKYTGLTSEFLGL